MKDIHYYLQQKKIRTRITFPPLIVGLIGVILAFVHAYFNFSFHIPLVVRIVFILTSIWLMVVLYLMLWSDFKSLKKRYEKD